MKAQSAHGYCRKRGQRLQDDLMECSCVMCTCIGFQGNFRYGLTYHHGMHVPYSSQTHNCLVVPRHSSSCQSHCNVLWLCRRLLSYITYRHHCLAVYHSQHQMRVMHHPLGKTLPSLQPRKCQTSTRPRITQQQQTWQKALLVHSSWVSRTHQPQPALFLAVCWKML